MCVAADRWVFGLDLFSVFCQEYRLLFQRYFILSENINIMVDRIRNDEAQITQKWTKYHRGVLAVWFILLSQLWTRPKHRTKPQVNSDTPGANFPSHAQSQWIYHSCLRCKNTHTNWQPNPTRISNYFPTDLNSGHETETDEVLSIQRNLGKSACCWTT